MSQIKKIDFWEIEFANNIRSAACIESAWSVLITELQRLGFQDGKYGFSTLQTEQVEHEILFVGKYEPEWEEIYIGRELYRQDPVIVHCIKNTDPITYYDIINNAKNQHYVMKLALEYGHKNGISVPLRDNHLLSRGGLTMRAPEYINSKEFNNYTKDIENNIINISNIFHTNLHRPFLISDNRHLSEREKEILLWIISGKRIKEISSKLGTHEKTIDKQLRNARIKLNANNNTQAAIKAITLGLVVP